ncbi:MAG: hypothetical protein ACK5TN_16405, partial [Acidobacteriota bacterium]
MASPRKHLTLALGLILIAALNLYLYGPLFSPEERPYRGSIAQGYAGITRFIAEHPNPWGWNPQQYAGLPPPFTYPPQLPDWIHRNYPEARSYVTGAVRFWFNTWHDLHQLGG